MIVAVTGQKGGVGKSTTAICLAVCAMQRGQRVLLVDADPQGTVRTWGDVAAELGRPAPTIVAMGATMHRSGQLAALAKEFDLTIVDCPPRHGDVQRSALMVADVALLPCGPSAADAWALSGTLDVIGEARALRDDLRACILITRKQGRTALAKQARKVLSSSGLHVLETELASRVAYQEAIAEGRGVTDVRASKAADKGAASLEIGSLLEELERFAHGEEGSHGLPAAAEAS